MEVILLQRVPKLGQMGESVRVKDGYARNFLLPQGKALRATEANKKRFEGQRAQLEARNLELKAEAEGVHGTLDGKTYIIIRQAGETGQLYGSVSTRDIADAITRRRRQRQPQPGEHHLADQGHRPAHDPGAAAPGSRGRRSRSTSPVRPKRPIARLAARSSTPAKRPTWTTSASKSAQLWRKQAATTTADLAFHRNRKSPRSPRAFSLGPCSAPGARARPYFSHAGLFILDAPGDSERRASGDSQGVGRKRRRPAR